MHDKDISNYLVSTTSNQLKAFEPTKDSYTHSAMTSTNKLSQTDGSKTNLILSAKKMYNGQDYGNGYDVFFIRPVSGGATLKKCSAYIQIPTSKMIPLDGGDGNAKMSIVFEDDPFIDNQDISTTINDALQSDQTINVDNAEWYNLNGQKLKGKPTSGGLYIMNGKKVLVK